MGKLTTIHREGVWEGELTRTSKWGAFSVV